MSGDAGGASEYGSAGLFTTKFNLNDLNGLKGMLDGANVQQVKEVAQNWQDLHDQLVGPGEGGGGIQKRFDDAVKKVLESWHGDTADKFRKRAEQISQNFTAGAPYASHTSQVMHQTANDLQKAVDKVKPVDDGWNWDDDVWGEMPWSDQIDDDDLNKALQSGVSTQAILDANKDNLSGHQTKRLQAAVAMENLGSCYVMRASSLKPPATGGGPGWREDKIPEHNGGGDGGVGTMPMPFPTGGGMGGGGAGGGAGGGGGGGGVKIPTRGMKAAPMPKTPESPNTPGISGGMGSMKPKIPDVTTGLDGAHGGGPGGPGGAGVKIPGGGGGGGTGVHMPSGGGGGGTGVNVPAGGGLGMPGGGSRGMGGVSGSSKGGASGLKGGGASGLKGGAAGPGGAGARTGRPGMPGMGGAHGGAGKGAGGGRAGVSTGGAQARQKGGLVGSTGGKASGGAQGGSGLHRSRGGTAAGTGGSGGRRPAGMMGGAHGAHGGKGEGKGQDGNRPDYLVEEEETWTPERNVAPRVIE
ncbi:WXG100 family type VII secretion target [Streptomyces gilvosporeus]|uniref:PPE family domain-containing protein n=1 Tax=Streptomyces gilvosporeus TaxID=553510 RepID=A0A1V0TXQ3_9ACTN|nr:hypothetical protein [Streptomyces gilvosporeus]ARF57724.1 hypothetical protein B1H19_29175 [Streptomyces gilvosporeus]